MPCVHRAGGSDQLYRETVGVVVSGAAPTIGAALDRIAAQPECLLDLVGTDAWTGQPGRRSTEPAA